MYNYSVILDAIRTLRPRLLGHRRVRTETEYVSHAIFLIFIYVIFIYVSYYFFVEICTIIL